MQLYVVRHKWCSSIRYNISGAALYGATLTIKVNSFNNFNKSTHYFTKPTLLKLFTRYKSEHQQTWLMTDSMNGGSVKRSGRTDLMRAAMTGTHRFGPIRKRSSSIWKPPSWPNLLTKSTSQPCMRTRDNSQ